MADRSSNHPDDPSSEVGFSRVNESTNGASNSDTQWRLLFELQNQQMQALIHALKSPSVNNHVVLPEFNPEKQEAEAASWCSTADLCFGECAMEESQLVMTISKAECRTRKINAKKPSPAPAATSSLGQRQQTGSLTCYKCGAPGHIASRCTAPASRAAAPAEK